MFNPAWLRGLMFNAAKHYCYKIMFFFTVIIGSRGPNISSFMIAESSGASRNNVGAIFLQRSEEIV
jgi:hypothetical protein